MNIIDLLKQDGKSVRIDCGATWMYWDETAEEWVVLNLKYRAITSTTLYRGKSEEDAVAALWKEESDETE